MIIPGTGLLLTTRSEDGFHLTCWDLFAGSQLASLSWEVSVFVERRRPRMDLGGRCSFPALVFTAAKQSL
jgi:hypothetical protein